MATIRFFWTLLFLFMPMVSHLLSNQDGDLFIHNFYPEDYKASPQMFMSDEDEQGLIYFANNEGVSIYDGSRWQLITLPNRSRINHLSCARPGHVYISATAEFGELVSDHLGAFSYRSFKTRLPESEQAFQEIIHCYALPDHQYFITRDRIFCFDDNQAKVFRLIPAGGVRFGDRLFILKADTPGLFALTPEGVLPIDGSDKLGVIRTLTQISETQILLRGERDAFLFDPDAAEERLRFTMAQGPLVEQILNEKDRISYSRIADNLFAMTTPKDPLILLDGSGRMRGRISKKNGLLSNEIHHVRLDRFGNLWISQNRGVSYVQLSSPLSRFAENRGIDSMPLAVISHNETIYTSTFTGIHYKTPQMSSFAHISDTQVPCFAFFIDPQNRLLASDGQRLLHIEGDRVTELYRARDFIFTIARSPLRKDILFLGLGSGLVSLRQSPASKQLSYSLLHDYEQLNHAVRIILPDETGALWLGLEFHGICRLSFPSADPQYPGITEMVTPPPLDQEEDTYIAMHRNTLFASSSKGLFRFDKPQNGPPFVIEALQLGLDPQKVLEKRIILDISAEYLWIHGNQQLLRLQMNQQNQFRQDRIPFAKIDSASVESIFTDYQGNSWICSNTGLFRLDAHKEKNYNQEFSTRLRRITTESGRTIHYGLADQLPRLRSDTEAKAVGKDEEEIVLPFRDHSLLFEYTALFYEHGRQNQYQYMLEGHDRQWSNWSSSNQKEYTNLPHGKFTFKVRARNIFGTIGSADSFAFEIEAPWYLRLWAWLIYGLLTASLVRLILFVYTRGLKKRQIVLEKAVIERTREVEEQKRQIAEKNRILNELATKDDLTGIANHRRIMEYYRSEWQRALREQTSIGVLLADIDNFKDYNDHFGHLQGDQCLLKVAGAFDSCALRPADMAGRYGGEEFLMILPQTSPEGILKVAENILQAVRDLNIPQTEGLQREIVTISIGVVSAIPRADMNPQLLLILADQALYRSKGQGKDRVTLAQQYSAI